MAHVLIAGAGIGGLTAGLALAQSGHQVDILERTKVLSEVGAGLQLSPNAMHVMATLGLKSTLMDVGFQPENAVVLDYQTGEPRFELPLRDRMQAKYGAPYLNLHRADLQQTLLETALAAGAQVHLGVEAANFDQNTNEVRVADYQGDLLIGADGIRSSIAAQMFGPQDPRFTGQIAWRGTVAADAVPHGTIKPNATVWVGDGLHIVTYLLRGMSQISFVAVEERYDWRAEDWEQQGDVAQFRARFAQAAEPLQTLFSAVENVHLWGLFDRPARPSWVDGRVALLGDAAHPMLPFMAQGAAMAIEDAWVLADAISRFDGPDALKRYQNARHTRATRVQDMSRANADLYHRPNSVLNRAKMKIAQLLPSVAHARLASVYGVKVTRETGL
ncbi:FAD-dependent monooxygenase [Thalassobium sp. R2A62]|jgi:salicylate hydroxylase|uniref:FAD-dependent monooxygenase n=1 Tax=Thalassobium sp. R2A62 TaxID=633131 RepID=UPI0001B1D693|nr:FAD-dependent monooxygenase [Thalassobium sp. R2A62]EET49284.1 salicylate 1-monooxygenase [Thalassobium sp. R2A62]MDG1338970.1 FAD-dependent monooxygenase [Paracoccaceae bacterium]MDG2453587.1 FAD-dependent monooxygenase [Paracoccaceae bacterium]